MSYKREMINLYERENTLLNIKSNEIMIFQLCGLVLARIIFDIYRFDTQYAYIIAFLFGLSEFLKRRYLTRMRAKKVEDTILKHKNDCEIEVILESFEELLKNKKPLESAQIVIAYLGLLFSLELFDDFKDVYLRERNVMKLPFMKGVLKGFVKKYDDLPEDVRKNNTEMRAILSKDLKGFYGIFRFVLIPGYLIVLVTLGLFSLDLKEEASIKRYVSDMAFQDFIIEDVHGFIENRDMKVAIAYGTDFDYEHFPNYYLASIDYSIENFIPKKQLKTEKLSYLGEDIVYTYRGDESTYVAILSQNPLKIIYDGEEIADGQKEELKKTAYQKTYMYYFMIDGAYDENLLEKIPF